MSDIIFAEGMMFRKPHENAPEFVKGRISVKVDEFTKWAKKHENEKGWIDIDLKKSKEGKLYLSLNTWRKDEVKAEKEDDELPVIEIHEELEEEAPKADTIDPADLPF